MINNPIHGWCDFNLEDFHGTPSYLTDVPADLLNAFIDLLSKGQGVVWFDEEGTEFSLVLLPYSIFIIEERGEKPVLHDCSCNECELARELIDDIESNIDEWKWWDIDPEIDNGNTEEYKCKLLDLIGRLDELLKKRGY